MGSFQTPASPSTVKQPASVSASDTSLKVCSVYVASTFLCVNFHCTLQLAIVAVCTVYITTTVCLSEQLKVCTSILLSTIPVVQISHHILVSLALVLFSHIQHTQHVTVTPGVQSERCVASVHLASVPANATLSLRHAPCAKMASLGLMLPTQMDVQVTQNIHHMTSHDPSSASHDLT